MGGVVIAAPASASGKTLITLGLLSAFSRQGVRVSSLKVGPDYIDPQFHHQASGRPCGNLDIWAMRPETFLNQVAQAQTDADLILAEGVMGLFDGARSGDGSTADVAAKLDWPVILVVDVRGQAASAAAVVDGFVAHRKDVRIGGVIFNRVGSDQHAAILNDAMAGSAIPVLGCLPRNEELALPERHLGLVQAGESSETEQRINAAATHIEVHIDLDQLRALAGAVTPPALTNYEPAVPPLGSRIAVARDEAFSFAYPFQLEGWRRAGADITFFSPLKDESPDTSADAIFLPGGYPELHAERLAHCTRFIDCIRTAADRGAIVYGECGGYMVLGETLTDSAGKTHPMIGLLPVKTSFQDSRLHLGYRALSLATDGPLGPRGATFRGHEFHYSRILQEETSASLFEVSDALGQNLPATGCRLNSVMGSFIHLIDHQAPSQAG
jgi:cobyrinic acid a,c-diamide synthase